MRKINSWFLVLGFILISGFCFGQNQYMNADGTISDEFYREQFVKAFNNGKSNDRKFDIEGKYLVVITKYDCGDEKFKPLEMRYNASVSFNLQALDGIIRFKKIGLKELSNYKFEGIIFKTNSICMFETRRCDFKFSLDELNSFPEYMDYQEFVTAIINNDGKNMIYIKNPDTE